MESSKFISIDNLEVRLRSCSDNRGVLTFAEEEVDFPFPLKRIFWITDIPTSAQRGGHAHKTCKELVCCVMGSFRLVVDNGNETREFFLNRPDYAVIIPEGVWCSLEDFSEGTIVVVGASEEYATEGYIRDYREYLMEINK